VRRAARPTHKLLPDRLSSSPSCRRIDNESEFVNSWGGSITIPAPEDSQSPTKCRAPVRADLVSTVSSLERVWRNTGFREELRDPQWDSKTISTASNTLYKSSIRASVSPI
jgi:hypothetical protein